MPIVFAPISGEFAGVIRIGKTYLIFFLLSWNPWAEKQGSGDELWIKSMFDLDYTMKEP